MEADFIEQAEPVIAALNSELEEAAPDAEDFDWPEADEADESDDDPLYDSARDYLGQIARYKAHQGILLLSWLPVSEIALLASGWNSSRSIGITPQQRRRQSRVPWP